MSPHWQNGLGSPRFSLFPLRARLAPGFDHFTFQVFLYNMLSIKQLYQRIFVLEQELHRLRADRSSRMIMSKIPAEIMAQIFQDVRDPRHPKTLNAFLHTCRYV
jgi:uncharacterized small protein (DUF1192 family)